jgi:hypothetical protein
MFRNKVEVLSAAGLLRIHLTRGKCAIVDDTVENRQLLVDHTFRYQPQRRKASCQGYAVTSVLDRTTMLHNMVLMPPNGLVCDHYNRYTLDCRRVNLRAVTVRTNTLNRTTFMHSMSMITYDKHRRCYNVQWVTPKGKHANYRVYRKKYEEESLYVALYIRNQIRKRFDHYRVVQVPPPSYDSSVHALDSKYFDAAIEVDPTAPVAFVARV